MTIADPKILKITEFGHLVETADGSLTVRHQGHGQDFHSSEGARFEAWELYVVASGFRASLASDGRALSVLDVGMGLGYNAVATMAAWLYSDGLRSLQMVSLEIDPRLPAALLGGQAPWCQNWSAEWLAVLRHLKKTNDNEFTAEMIHPKSEIAARWRIVVGDGSKTDLQAAIAPSILGLMPKVDYIWQDPFTPELNPDMWSGEWFRRLCAVSHGDTRLMTYSVSRVVKEALTAGGWAHERFRTPGRKRHWLRATPKAH
jgi:tRNA U34 5-methylaminomethyl-2-thiouridine-forming methyltransferase MnmC